MAKEIERKFLVQSDRWKSFAGVGVELTQAYISTMEDRNVRIRLYEDGRAKLTIKTGKSGLVRDEVEFAVPFEQAQELLTLAIGNIIEKTRFEVPYEGFTWEIDVYRGSLAGLVVAEVELQNEDQRPAIPSWISAELTGDESYSNQSLALYGLPAIRNYVGNRDQNAAG